MDTVKSILVVKFWGIGSIVLAYDFLQALRTAYPEAHLCALTLDQNAEAFRVSGLCDEIFTIDGKLLFRNPGAFLMRLLKMVLRLRRRFSISFDLEFTARSSALISWLIASPRRLGFSYAGVWRGNNYTATVAFDENTKLRDSYVRLLMAATGKTPPPLPPLTLHLPPEADAAVCAHLKSLLPPDAQPLIGININASDLCLLRRWPQENFVSLSEKLINTYGAFLLFIGLPQDHSYIEETIASIAPGTRSHAYNVAGLFPLVQLFALMPKLNLLVTNDSGPLHIAVRCGIPTISFFGPETPNIYGPAGQHHHIYYAPLECSPCIRIKNYKFAVCHRNQQCLRSITPQKVWDDLERTGTFRSYRR